MPLTPRLRSLGLLAVAGAVSLPLPVVQADEDLTCHRAGNVIEQTDGWYRIQRPEFDINEGTPRIRDMAVSAASSKRLYVTNGTVVKRSANNGCDWGRAVFPLDDSLSRSLPKDAAAAASIDRVVDIDVGRESGGDDVLYIVTADKTNVDEATADPTHGAYHPRVWVSENANKADIEITERSNGLPAAGRPLRLVTTGRNRVAHVLVDVQQPDLVVAGFTVQPAMPGIALFSTFNAGVAWQRTKLPAGLSGAPDGIVAAANNFGGLYVWKGSTFWATADFGNNWTEHRMGGPIVGIETLRQPGSVFPYLDVFVNKGPQQSVVRSSVDGGRTFKDRSVPGPVLGASRIDKPELFAVSTPKGIFGYDLRLRQWLNVTPKGGSEGIQGLTFAKSSRPGVLYGFLDEEILRKSLYYPNLFAPVPVPPLGGLVDPIIWNPAVSTCPVPTIHMQESAVAVDPGQTTRVNAQLCLPPDPIPVDVFFLMDTTGSMQPTIEGLKNGIRGIVSALTQQRVNARFGIGEFKDVGDYPPRHCRAGEPQCVYRVVRNLGPADQQFEFALQTMRADGGALDEPEAQTIALTQAATGLGDPSVPIQPGLRAAFAPEAIKVIMLITDAAFKSGAQYPSLKSTIRTLVTRDINVVGIVSLTANDADAAEEDVRALVEGVGTLAPAGGLDCDGDRRMDVPPFAPLVCRNSGSGLVNLKDAVVSLLLGINDPGKIGVSIAAPGGVVQAAHGLLSGIFNLKEENRLTFQLELTCLPTQAGQRLPVNVYGSSRGVPVAQATIMVHCNALPTAPEVDIPPYIPPLVLAPAAIVPPPPPPAPPQPIQNPNPNPNVNPNAGMASQEEQQFQLAAVGQGGMETQEDEATEYAMSALDRESDATLPMLAGAMAVTGMATATMARRRLQRAPARCHARR